MLTPRQRDVLVFIDAFTRETGGISPSFDEIGAACGISSRGNVHANLEHLERRGFIRRWRGKRRAIEVLRAPPQPVAAGLAAFSTEQLRAELIRREVEALNAIGDQIRKAQRRA